MSRGLRLAIGALMILFGVVWTLQGLDVVHGSGMSGHAIWAVIGPIVALVGAYLFVSTVRRPPAGDDV
jgi:phosphate/sulfate permease